MRISYTLSVYFGRQFLLGFGIALGALSAMILLFDVAELTRRGIDRDGVSYFLLLEMGALQVPLLVQKVLPIAALFGGMFTFFRLTRSQQLVVTRSAGVSVWQFMAPALAMALAIGTVVITVFSPLVAAAVSRFDLLEARYFQGSANLLAVSSQGLWLRQADGVGQSVIHAEHVGAQGEELTGVTIFLYEGADHFVGRIDAQRGVLRNGYWNLADVLLTGPDRTPERKRDYSLPTSLTLAQIQDSFAPPDSLSFWELPAFIANLRAAGFSALHHRAQWHTLLATPFLLFAMVLIAGTFSLRRSRYNNTGLMVAAGVFAGFVVYVVSDVVTALGLSGNIPIALAAWMPTGLCTLLGVAMLFHLEDG